MEELAMTLMRRTHNWVPSFPSFFNRSFEGDLMDWAMVNFAEANSTLPAVNVKENTNEFVIEVAAPGLKKNDFKLNYENNRLTISGERKKESKNGNGDKITSCEFNYQSFRRSFSIPDRVVNTEKISARYKNGILHVKLPKHEEEKPKPVKEIKIS